MTAQQPKPESGELDARPKMTLPEYIRQRLWFQYGMKLGKEYDYAIQEEADDWFNAAADAAARQVEELRAEVDKYFNMSNAAYKSAEHYSKLCDTLRTQAERLADALHRMLRVHGNGGSLGEQAEEVLQQYRDGGRNG